MRRALLGLAVVLGSLVALPAGAATSPGSLAQTTVEPSFAGPLTSSMRTLFRAIESDSASLGATVFFPRGAYLRMKTGEIPDPASDYADRLIAFYDLDLAAYRRRLVAGATTTLLRVESSPHDAAWIPPGVCENEVGYWHVPGVRLVLERDGAVVSVEVASLISWRGVWYVVHLGPNPRPVDVGTVDGYEAGPGVPGPAGGC